MPQRVSDLWRRVIAFPNLLLAHRKARRGKRGRPEVAAFEFELEPRLFALQRELAGLTYIPGPYRSFTISEPKPRLISAAQLCRSIRRLKKSAAAQQMRPHSSACALPWLA